VRPLDCLKVHFCERIKSAAAEESAAARMAPRTHERRQAKDVAHGHAAARMTLQTIVHPNECRLGFGVLVRDALDRFNVDSGNLRDPRGRILLYPLSQPFESDGMSIDVILILQSVP